MYANLYIFRECVYSVRRHKKKGKIGGVLLNYPVESGIMAFDIALPP